MYDFGYTFFRNKKTRNEYHKQLFALLISSLQDQKLVVVRQFNKCNETPPTDKFTTLQMFSWILVPDLICLVSFIF